MPHSASGRRLWAGAALVVALSAGSAACAGETGGQPDSLPASDTSSAASSEPASSAPAPAASAPQAVAVDPSTIPIRPAVPEAEVSVPQPVRVTVEGTGIDLEVVPVGVEDNGAMTLPNNHYQAGWYKYGPAPGAAAGSAVLAAHVDSRTEQLPIAGLKDVPPGTIINVTREDGSVQRYAAEGVENIAKKTLDGHRLFERTGEPRLKLVTCGGAWLEAQDDYEDNVVLTAAPVS
ncbi:class F sortase [Arthrobacter sp. NPDC097144]|uniref:class F sortase n=1 Tax=Arthrobacter sp. NPDC097144 TaxID=3363946 RepID=UPI0038238EBD